MKGPYSSYNPFFLIPFIIWIVAGGIALLLFNKEELFRFFNANHTAALDSLMYYVTRTGEGVFTAVVLLMLFAFRTLRNWWYVIAALGCTVLSALLTQAVKSYVNAPRPLNYFKEASWIHTLPDAPRLFNRSFPSGHACGAFALFCLLSLLLTPRYRAYGIVFFIFALLVGYSRMYLAAHFFSDVYVGSILGTGFTVTLVSVLRYYQPRFFRKEDLSQQ